MPRPADSVTTRTLRARKTAPRFAMDLLYPRLRLRHRHPPQVQAQTTAQRFVSYLPGPIIVPPRVNLFTALAAAAVLGSILALVTLFSRMNLLQ